MDFYSISTVLGLQACTTTSAMGSTHRQRDPQACTARSLQTKSYPQHGSSIPRNCIAVTSGVDRLQTLLPWKRRLGACGRLGCSSQDLGRSSSWAGCFRCQTRYFPVRVSVTGDFSPMTTAPSGPSISGETQTTCV